MIEETVMYKEGQVEVVIKESKLREVKRYIKESRVYDGESGKDISEEDKDKLVTKYEKYVRGVSEDEIKKNIKDLYEERKDGRKKRSLKVGSIKGIDIKYDEPYNIYYIEKSSKQQKKEYIGIMLRVVGKYKVELALYTSVIG